MSGAPHIAAAMAAVELALDEMRAPHYPPPEEARHLGIALFHLVAAFDSRDFEPGEAAVWHYPSWSGRAWEIRLRQTDAEAKLPDGGSAF